MNAVFAPNFQTKRLATNQSAEDIVRGIGIAVTDSREASRLLSKQFYDKDPIKACEKLFDWMKNPDNIKYIRESASRQTVKSIPRILYDKLGDCKHYTIFSQGILTALGIPNYIMLISQDKRDKEPTHVYSVALVNGKKYVVDPVMDYFDQECYYYYSCPLKQKNMSLNYLSGAKDSAEFGRKKGGGLLKKAQEAVKNSKVQKTVGKTNGQIKKNFNRALDQQKQQLAKAGKTLKALPKKVAVIKRDIAKKKFLWFISQNGGGFATRLAAEYKKDPAAVKKFWQAWGKWEELRDAINAGNKVGAKISGDEEGGDQAAQYEAAAKESMGIIKQLIEWFKQRRADKKGDEQVAKNMEDYVNQDPTIPKVDEFGNILTEQTTASSNIQTLQSQIQSNTVENPEVVSTTSNSTDTGDPVASFGLTRINSFPTFLHWLRGILMICLALNNAPVIAAVITVGSFLYLTRYVFYGYTSTDTKGEGAGSPG